MRTTKIEHLPVINEENKPLGIISIHHIYGILINILEQLLGYKT